jgi:hypothetical protein
MNEKVALVDLTRISAARFQFEGPDQVKAQFIDDTVHTNIAGAEANARDVVSALRAIESLPLREMLSARGREVPADRGAPRHSVCPEL